MFTKKSTVHSLAVAAILLVGGGVRVATNVAPGSLQFDELATALNVTERGWSELLEPLGYQQVAPIGFIAAEKAGVTLLGPTESGLRLFPLIASIASLFLFWRVASRYLEGASLLAALALFAVSPALVWYARKAKQYSGDVGATLFLLWLALRFLEGRSNARQAWIAGVAGGAAILISQPAVLVAVGLALVLLYDRWRSKQSLVPLVPLGAGWAAGIVLQALTTLRLIPHETQDFMTSAWSFAFFPAPWDRPDAFLWLPQRLFDFVGFFVGLLESDSWWEIVFVGVYSILAVLGMLRLVRGRKPSVALLFTPLVVAVLASALRLLPLSGRLMIYVGPMFLVSCLAGVEEIRSRARPRLLPAVLAGGMVLGAGPVLFLPFLIPFLNRREDAHSVLLEVRERWRQDDVMYVYHGGVQAMKFYGEPLGLAPWIEGGRHDPDARAYLREVDALRGRRRVWFFQTHAGGCKVPVIRSYLETIGKEIDRVEDPHGVRGMHETAAQLYDLADPERLARSSVVSHPLFDRQDPRCRDPDSPAPVGKEIKGWLRNLLANIGG